MPEKNKIAQIDLAPERLGRRARVDLGLCGDAKETIKALLPLIKVRDDRDFLDEQLKYYEKVKKILKPMSKTPVLKIISSRNFWHPLFAIRQTMILFLL